MFAIGIDLGSSSVKVALVNINTKKEVLVVQHPKTEMKIDSPQDGWAEQDPELWWQYTCAGIRDILDQTSIGKAKIKSIGIAYQMHGLVIVDSDKKSLRPAIIWCDNRAVGIGQKAYVDMGEQHCLNNYLNSPSNFTASKLKWVEENEPEIYSEIYKFMLPGDYLAMRLTGKIQTTISGLSEGILWNFKKQEPAYDLLKYYEIDNQLLPDVVDTFSVQARLNKEASLLTGLEEGTLVSYRVGDQPNNAFSLGAIEPGQVAATGGTSGVVYGLFDKAVVDENDRVNAFAHVNHTNHISRIGLLLCINGAGSQYAWYKKNIAPEGMSYNEIEQMAASVPIGSEGLYILNFGNGSERILGNKDIGCHIGNINFNRHTDAHLARASLESIAFTFVYGIEILKNLGLKIKEIKAGNDNLFRSKIFSQTVSNLIHANIQVIATTGAIGAALGSAFGSGHVNKLESLFENLETEKLYNPENDIELYKNAYSKWCNKLELKLNKN